MIVADTGPLNYLILIHCIDILPQLHQRILIPFAFRNELLDPAAPPEVRDWALNLPHWVEVIDPAPEFLNDPLLRSLHDGERSALALAQCHQPILLLVDEWAARNIALKKGFPLVGTLGVLDEAARLKLISFANAIRELKRTSFRYPASIVDCLLAEHTAHT